MNEQGNKVLNPHPITLLLMVVAITVVLVYLLVRLR